MSITLTPGAAFSADAAFGPSFTGLTGTVGVQLIDSTGAVVTGFARTTSGISESPTGSGDYTKTFTAAPTTFGTYRLAWDTGGSSPQWAFEDVFVAYSTSSLTPPTGSDLCTLSDVRAGMEIASTDTTRDALIQQYITAASAKIISECDRELAPITTATRRFYLEPFDLGYRVEFAPYDLQSASSVVLNPEQSGALTLTGPGNSVVGGSSSPVYNLEPLTPKYGVYTRLHLSPFLPIFSSLALKLGQPMVDVTGTWGFPAVPNEARQACIVTVRAWLDRSVAAWGQRDVTEAGPGIIPVPDSSWGLPPGARILISRLKRWAV